MDFKCDLLLIHTIYNSRTAQLIKSAHGHWKYHELNLDRIIAVMQWQTNDIIIANHSINPLQLNGPAHADNIDYTPSQTQFICQFSHCVLDMPYNSHVRKIMNSKFNYSVYRQLLTATHTTSWCDL
jgi:hypothetical protein